MNCQAPECGRGAPYTTLRLCNSHYQQQRRGRPLTPLKGPHGRLHAEGGPRMTGVPHPGVQPCDATDYQSDGASGPTIAQTAPQVKEAS